MSRKNAFIFAVLAIACTFVRGRPGWAGNAAGEALLRELCGNAFVGGGGAPVVDNAIEVSASDRIKLQQFHVDAIEDGIELATRSGRYYDAVRVLESLDRGGTRDAKLAKGVNYQGLFGAINRLGARIATDPAISTAQRYFPFRMLMNTVEGQLPEEESAFVAAGLRAYLENSVFDVDPLSLLGGRTPSQSTLDEMYAVLDCFAVPSDGSAERRSDVSRLKRVTARGVVDHGTLQWGLLTLQLMNRIAAKGTSVPTRSELGEVPTVSSEPVITAKDIAKTKEPEPTPESNPADCRAGNCDLLLGEGGRDLMGDALPILASLARTDPDRVRQIADISGSDEKLRLREFCAFQKELASFLAACPEAKQHFRKLADRDACEANSESADSQSEEKPSEEIEILSAPSPFAPFDRCLTRAGLEGVDLGGRSSSGYSRREGENGDDFSKLERIREKVALVTTAKVDSAADCIASASSEDSGARAYALQSLAESSRITCSDLGGIYGRESLVLTDETLIQQIRTANQTVLRQLLPRSQTLLEDYTSLVVMPKDRIAAFQTGFPLLRGLHYTSPTSSADARKLREQGANLMRKLIRVASEMTPDEDRAIENSGYTSTAFLGMELQRSIELGELSLNDALSELKRIDNPEVRARLSWALSQAVREPGADPRQKFAPIGSGPYQGGYGGGVGNYAGGSFGGGGSRY